MPAEMGELERTDGPGNHDKVDFIRPGNQNRDVRDGIILHPDPTSVTPGPPPFHDCSPAVASPPFGTPVSPSPRPRIVHPGFRKAVAVNDTHSPRDHAAEVQVVRVKFRGKYQHGVVESELGFRGRALPQGRNALENPISCAGPRLLGRQKWRSTRSKQYRTASWSPQSGRVICRPSLRQLSPPWQCTTGHSRLTS